MNPKPLLKKPHWGWNVVAYLTLGGLAGANGILAELARRSGDRALERRTRYIALAAVTLCPPVLISHLGRPERFLNMMRVVKLKSPMSLGVWGLVGYSALSGINVLPFAPRALTSPLQALFGAFIAGYTGVLLGATAVPLWAKGKAHIPAISVCASTAGACAIAAALTPRDEQGSVAKLARLELAAGAAEAVLLLHFERCAGETGAPLFKGRNGETIRTLTLGLGLVLPMLLNAPAVFGRSREHRRNALTVIAAGLTVAGGYIFRRTLVEAGKASADDPAQAFVQTE